MSDALEQLRAVMARTKLQPRPVTVPGWGTVYVLPISVGDAERLRGEAQDQGDGSTGKAWARGVLGVLCDEQGERLPFDASDVDAMARQPWELVKPITDAAGASGAVLDEAKND